MVIKIGCCHIGIRYPEGNIHLRGCHNDVKTVQSFISQLYGNNDNFTIDYHIIIDTSDKICGVSNNIFYNTPTTNNIKNTLLNMINKYDYVILSYSGHGTYITDWNGDEKDGQDEAICPIDFQKSGFISDDWIKNQFLSKLNKNVKVRILMDCCHSGTIMDLKYKYDIRYPNIDSTNFPALECDVQCLSGCGDDQSSFDVYTAFKFQGAFTNCFIKSFDKNINTKRLCYNINNELEKGGWGGDKGQISKYTSSRPILNNDIFFLYLEENNNINTTNILNLNDTNTTSNNQIVPLNNNDQSLDLFMSMCNIL